MHELSWAQNDRYYYKAGSFLFQQRVYFSVNIRWHLFEYSHRHGRLPNRHTWLCILGLALNQLSRSLDSCYLLFFHNLMTFVFCLFYILVCSHLLPGLEWCQHSFCSLEAIKWMRCVSCFRAYRLQSVHWIVYSTGKQQWLYFLYTAAWFQYGHAQN